MHRHTTRKSGSMGMVDNLSRLLVFGIEDQGRLSIRWSDGSCSVDYQLPPKNKDLTYERVALSCRRSSISEMSPLQLGQGKRRGFFR
ncbi:FimD/PapC C-terminal domain-containing protein [Pseudomonas aeruginosa]|nr:FimD/PapC C-terminal domain-containing protein [Pseudomonas aeruginosa]